MIPKTLRAFSTGPEKAGAEKKKPEESTDKKFDYSKLDYYEILECIPSANEKQLKVAYLKCARKYHPDVYKGVNKTHFTRCTEAYNLLKNPIKRKEYDRKQKIHKMRDSDEFKAYAQKARMQGSEFTHEMYQEMKKRKQKERVVRESQDPEIQEAWRKVNVELMFKEFQSRPQRSTVNEMAEEFMAMHHEKRMSRRERARRDFVRKHKLEQYKKKNLRNQIVAERERFLDLQEQVHYQSAKPLRQMKYDELLETLNKDVDTLQLLDGKRSTNIQVFKEEKEMQIQQEKERTEIITKTKQVVYPLYVIGAVIGTLVMYGWYQQEQLIKKNTEKLEKVERIENYQYT